MLFAVYLIGDEPLGADEQEYLRIASALGDEIVRSPLGLGFPLLIAPFGEGAAAVVLAGVAALGFVLAALLARRIVPEPYASFGAGLAGLSAPAVAYAGTILPGATAAHAARGRDAVRGDRARGAAAGAGLRGRGDARRAAVARSAATWSRRCRSPSRCTCGAAAGGAARWG